MMRKIQLPRRVLRLELQVLLLVVLDVVVAGVVVAGVQLSSNCLRFDTAWTWTGGMSWTCRLGCGFTLTWFFLARSSFFFSTTFFVKLFTMSLDPVAMSLSSTFPFTFPIPFYLFPFLLLS